MLKFHVRLHLAWVGGVVRGLLWMEAGMTGRFMLG